MQDSPWPEAQKLFAYFDETSFDTGGRSLGYGMLLTNIPVDASIVETALADLRKDPDFDPRYDRATLMRGAFHASEDSKNAHSFLCRAIVSSVQGEFFYATTRSDQPSRVVHYSKTPTTEDHYDLMLADTYVRTITRTRHVDIVVEQRSGLTESRLTSIFDRILSRLEKAASSTAIPFFAPNVNFRTSDKSEPGLQVVDFVLWALNRRALTMACPWVDRLRLKPVEAARAEGSPEKSEVWILGLRPSYVREDYPSTALPIPAAENQHLESGLEMIRQRLLALSCLPFPSHAAHLGKRLEMILPALMREATSPAVAAAASLFLRVFDTLPIYHGLSSNDTEAWRRLLFLRSIASTLISRLSHCPGDDPPATAPSTEGDVTLEVFVNLSDQGGPAK